MIFFLTVKDIFLVSFHEKKSSKKVGKYRVCRRWVSYSQSVMNLTSK